MMKIVTGMVPMLVLLGMLCVLSCGAPALDAGSAVEPEPSVAPEETPVPVSESIPADSPVDEQSTSEPQPDAAPEEDSADTPVAPEPVGPPPAPEIAQPETDLLWMRCPVGQEWENEKCKGKATRFKSDKSTEACPKPYRLPTWQEYQDMLGGCAGNPIVDNKVKCKKCKEHALCKEMFAKDVGFYWSMPSEGTDQWSAHFADGTISRYNRSKPRKASLQVRCVREL